MSIFNSTASHIRENLVYMVLDKVAVAYPDLDTDELLQKLKDHTDVYEYHNYQHCYQVALNAFDGAQYHGLSEETAVEMFFAGLFHDACYSRAELDGTNYDVVEEKNLRDAVEFAKFSLRDSGLELPRMHDLIYATRFPRASSLGTLEEQILADADLLQNVAVDRHDWYQALAEETGTVVTEDTSRSWLVGQIDTLFFTDWAKEQIRETFEPVENQPL